MALYIYKVESDALQIDARTFPGQCWVGPILSGEKKGQQRRRCSDGHLLIAVEGLALCVCMG